MVGMKVDDRERRKHNITNGQNLLKYFFKAWKTHSATPKTTHMTYNVASQFAFVFTFVGVVFTETDLKVKGAVKEATQLLYNKVVKAEKRFGFGMELNKIIKSVEINGS